MMLMSIIVPMIGLMLFGKQIKKFQPRHYVIAAFVAMIQLSFVIFKMFTMEKPPLF